MSNELATTSPGADVETFDLPPALHLPVGIAPKPLQVGKIRAGEKATSKNGKQYPRSLDRWRFTHPSEDVIRAVAEAYGGTAEEWSDPKARPTDQWHVVTTTNTVDVIVATEGAFTFVYESWSEAGVSMRTDGRVNLITGELLSDPCPADDPMGWAERHGLKLTARVTVTPLDLPGLTEWMVETHSIHSTQSLVDAAQKLLYFAGAGVSHVKARLVLTPAQGQVPVRGAAAVKKAKEAPKNAGYRQMADGAWVQKTNFVLIGLEIVTQTPREMLTLAEAAHTRKLELATRRLELAAAEEAENTAQLAKRPHAKRNAPADDFSDLEGSDTATVRVAAVKTDAIRLFQGAGLDEAAAKSRAADYWRAKGLPASGHMPQAQADDVLAAVTALLVEERAARAASPADEDIIDAVVVEDNPFAIGDGDNAGEVAA